MLSAIIDFFDLFSIEDLDQVLDQDLDQDFSGDNLLSKILYVS